MQQLLRSSIARQARRRLSSSVNAHPLHPPPPRPFPPLTTPRLNLHPPAALARIPTFGLVDEDGALRPGAELDADLTRDVLVRAYGVMVRNVVLDGLLYESQRQGRISFYLTAYGEEGAVLGAAMALHAEDEVLAQYREVGLLLWRGFPLSGVMNQVFANVDDVGKGRQMPVHYGSAQHHFHTISSPLATQIPQAAGVGYALKLASRDNVACCFFGEGAASEGDFHAGLNIASTMEAPVLFFCRNNQYAISTHEWEQYRGDGIAPRGLAYGMHTVRCDGNDVFAVYAATKAARAIALGRGGEGAGSHPQPVLIEAMNYRESHHSTSDDSSRYRSTEEIKQWKEGANPVLRLRRFLERAGWWSESQEASLLAEERAAVLKAMSVAEGAAKPPLASLFEDVYKEVPKHLAAQREAHVTGREK